MARRKPRKAVPHKRIEGYDSTFEHDLHKTILKKWEHHSSEIPYHIEKRYYPDFTRTVGDITYYVEAKGRMWTGDEAAKYVWVSKSLRSNEKLILIFADPSLPMPGSRKRKNGTRRSHAEWGDSNGITWYTTETFPKWLR